jgi:hypothetical protein
MNPSETFNQSAKNRQKILLSTLRKKNWVLVLSFGVLGFILPMFYGYFNGIPVPQVHDELSYLLAADTFAHGRLTNPTPISPENFETPHVLVEPYMAKYPPLQGLFLALGQVVFGQPIFGVWLTCGLAAASLYWMLFAWTRPRWAIFGTCLMILFIGINSYWAQSYWGGMVAASGGAIFLGGFRRLLRKISVQTTILMILGGIILVNSRAYEGTAMMLPSLIVLAIFLIRDKKTTLFHKFSHIILPGVLLTATALSAMAYYNYRITGNLLTFPYTAHQSQYFSTPLFVFQPKSEKELRGHPRLQSLYEYLNCSQLIRELDFYGLPNNKNLYPLYAIGYLIVIIPGFLLSTPLSFFFYLITFIVIFKNRWMLFIFGTILFTFGCMSLVNYWDCPHYPAPLAACFYLLISEGFRFCLIDGKRRNRFQITAGVLIVLSGVSLIYQIYQIPDYFFPVKSATRKKDFSDLDLKFDQPVKLAKPERITYLKPVIENAANNLPDKYLAIVEYPPKFDNSDELVYNKADMNNSKLIWAYDLGEEKNKTLLNYYSDRKILKIKVSDGFVEINPQ